MNELTTHKAKQVRVKSRLSSPVNWTVWRRHRCHSTPASGQAPEGEGASHQNSSSKAWAIYLQS